MSSLGLFLTPAAVQLLLTSLPDLNALNDNSGPFMRYLNKQGLDGILQSTKLKSRKTHTIVPHVSRHAFNIPRAKC